MTYLLREWTKSGLMVRWFDGQVFRSRIWCILISKRVPCTFHWLKKLKTQQNTGISDFQCYFNQGNYVTTRPNHKLNISPGSHPTRDTNKNLYNSLDKDWGVRPGSGNRQSRDLPVDSSLGDPSSKWVIMCYILQSIMNATCSKIWG